MNSIWNEASREEIITRLNQLDSQKQPAWGQFTPRKMLAHLADSLKMALGHLPVKSQSSPFRYWPLKQLAVYWIPIPKGAPTSPELLARAAEPIVNEREAIINLINEFAEKQGSGNWPDHPAFGRLSETGWGVLIYRHMDFHRKQFGL